MRRNAVIISGLLVALAVAAVSIVHMAGQRSDQIDTNGVPTLFGVVRLTHGHEVCQRNLVPPLSYDGVRVWAVPIDKVPVLRVQVRANYDNRLLRQTTIAAGPPGFAPRTARFSPPLHDDKVIDVCIKNVGTGHYDLTGAYQFGSDYPPERQGDLPDGGRLLLDAKTIDGQMKVGFVRSHATSLLARIPEMFHRAQDFKPFGIGVWTFWLALAALLLAVPAGVLAATRAAAAADDDDHVVYPD